MKQLLRDTYIALAHITGVSWLYRAHVRTKGPLVRVIVFHDIEDREWFAESIRTLCTHCHMLTPEEFTAGNFDTKRINILVTFDDGYASWVDVCLPALLEYNVKALFFVNSGLLDAQNKEEQETFVRERLLLTKPHRILDWEGARTLLRAGHTIGGHTRTHMRLSELPVAEQEEEIKGDKVRLSTMLGTSATAIAYPFGNQGDYTEDTARLMSEAGYTHAFTTEGVFADMRTPYAISRLCIPDSLPPTTLRRWGEGGYDLYGILKKLCAR
ncbi:polysaccharide deacetylase family protein [Candidatus Kaiserbacteria bacterium]|nr:MAG: polysaccharide deacetylase family protein [Candidatus Kaiserbacteria bacterium]